MGTQYNSDIWKLSLDSNRNLKVTLASTISGEDVARDELKTSNRRSYAQINTSSVVKATPGFLSGIFVSSGTPTIKVWDSGSASGNVIVNTFTATSGTMYDFGGDVITSIGIYVEITGTAELTVFYK